MLLKLLRIYVLQSRYLFVEHAQYNIGYNISDMRRHKTFPSSYLRHYFQWKVSHKSREESPPVMLFSDQTDYLFIKHQSPPLKSPRHISTGASFESSGRPYSHLYTCSSSCCVFSTAVYVVQLRYLFAEYTQCLEYGIICQTYAHSRNFSIVIFSMESFA